MIPICTMWFFGCLDIIQKLNTKQKDISLHIMLKKEDESIFVFRYCTIEHNGISLLFSSLLQIMQKVVWYIIVLSRLVMQNIVQPTNCAVRRVTKWFVTAIFVIGQYVWYFALFSHCIEFFRDSIIVCINHS